MATFASSLKNGIQSAFTDLDLATKRAEIAIQQPDKQLPEYFTGARAKILVNGNTVGAALEVTWSVQSNITEVRTIDNFAPTEIVPGQMQIRATLKRVVSPNRTLGGDGLYSTMQSYLHQPYASIEVRDRVGDVIFLARGMFTDIQGTVTTGQLGLESVNFVGYYWRENVAQDFSPFKQDLATRALNRFTKHSLVKKVGSL